MRALALVLLGLAALPLPIVPMAQEAEALAQPARIREVALDGTRAFGTAISENNRTSWLAAMPRQGLVVYDLGGARPPRPLATIPFEGGFRAVCRVTETLALHGRLAAVASPRVLARLEPGG